MFDHVKESVSRQARRLSRASKSGLRSSSRDSPSSSQYNENSPRQSDAPEFPQHPGVNPIANKPLPHRPNIESQQDSSGQGLPQHPVFNPRHSDAEPRSPVLDSPRHSITGHRKHPSNGGHNEGLNFNEMLSEHPALKPLGSDMAPRNEASRHSRNSSAAMSQHERDNSRNSYERNYPRSSSDGQRHAINQQYVPGGSGSRRQSQSSQDQQFNAPPLDESMKKPLPLEPIQAGETPMEFSNSQPVYPEPISRKPVALESTPEATRSGRNLDEHRETNAARGGSVPGVGFHEKHNVPPPIEVSAEILKHVDSALPNLSKAEGSSLSSAQETRSLDNEQHYKLVNEDNFHATAKAAVATEKPDGSTDYRAPGVADFDAAKPHKEIYFDHEVHERNAVVHEEIKPHVHTIYEPKRTRSIHYHEHRNVIQPISDPDPIVKPAQHWAEDHRTGEIFKIPDALGEQLLENAYDEFKRIDGCNLHGNEAALVGGFQELNIGGRGDESDALAQHYVSPEGHTGHRIHNVGGFGETRQQAGTSQYEQSGDRSNVRGVLGQSSTREYDQNTQQRQFNNRENISGGLGNSHGSNQTQGLQQGELAGRRNIAQDFNKLNLNDQPNPSSSQPTTSQQQLQQHSGQEQLSGRTSSERSSRPQGRRPSLPADPRQTSPPQREWRIQRPSLFPDV